MAEKHTIEDIARLAGVSKATVSRVLNNKPDVDPATRARILRIVEEVGFVPSITASGLAGGRSRLIGVLIPSFTWPFIPDVLRGVAEVISTAPYELVLYSIKDSTRDRETATRERETSTVINHILATRLTAGILAIFPGFLSHYMTQLHKQGVPMVVIDDQKPPTETPWVGADNYHGAYEAVRHLLNLGHRRIAHIRAPLAYLCSHERYQGYCDALQTEGITPEPQLVLEGDFTTSGGYVAASKLLALPEEARPTAIFAASDQTAYGVFTAAEEYGLDIPQDVALVGFDDIAASTHLRPALTTVRQPFYEMGQHGIELLLSMLTSNTASPLNGNGWSSKLAATPFTREMNYGDPIRIQLPTNLVVRASCGSSQNLSIPR